jgi:hypothetical protein
MRDFDQLWVIRDGWTHHWRSRRVRFAPKADKRGGYPMATSGGTAERVVEIRYSAAKSGPFIDRWCLADCWSPYGHQTTWCAEILMPQRDFWRNYWWSRGGSNP